MFRRGHRHIRPLPYDSLKAFLLLLLQLLNISLQEILFYPQLFYCILACRFLFRQAFLCFLLPVFQLVAGARKIHVALAAHRHVHEIILQDFRKLLFRFNFCLMDAVCILIGSFFHAAQKHLQIPMLHRQFFPIHFIRKPYRFFLMVKIALQIKRFLPYREFEPACKEGVAVPGFIFLVIIALPRPILLLFQPEQHTCNKSLHCRLPGFVFPINHIQPREGTHIDIMELSKIFNLNFCYFHSAINASTP